MSAPTPCRHPSTNVFLASLAVAVTVCCGLAATAPPAEAQAAFAARLVAEDGAAFDNLGLAVAVSGSTAVIGAPGDDEWGRRDGAAYVFERDPDDGSWAQVAKLIPPMPNKSLIFGAPIDQGDNFGKSVAIAGDVVVVGAPGEDIGAAVDAGAAYVFERDAGGADNWGRVARLTAGTAAADRRFGLAVAADGETVVVGAPGDPSALLFVGSAYVYDRDDLGDWTAVAELDPGDGATGDFFGFAVAIDGEAVLVGAPFADPAGFYSGSAYVFERDGTGGFLQVARLVAPDGDPGDRFGYAVGLADGTAVLGSPRDDVPAATSSGRNSGSVFVFERSASGAWEEAAKLVAADNFQNDRFGTAVAIAGDTVAAGAPGKDAYFYTGRYGGGSVYVFRRDGEGGWTEKEQLFDEDALLFDLLGSAVAVSGVTLLAGTPDNDDRGPASGSAMVFELGPGDG